MKKLIVLLMFIPLLSMGQNKITFSSDLELGYESFKTSTEYHLLQDGLEINDFARYESPWFYSGTLSFGIHYWKFSFDNHAKTYFSNFSTENFTFDVDFVKYESILRFNHKNIEIGYSHHCFHPVYSSHKFYLQTNSDKFYLKLKIK